MNWIIFYDTVRNKVAASAMLQNNTCTITNYWENGKVKAVEVYHGLVLTHVEYYCENGTLVWKKNYSSHDLEGVCVPTSDTVYYCNGNIMNSYSAETYERTFWYENGKKALEGIEKKCLNEGTWIEYDTSGKPVGHRYYSHGEFIGSDTLH